MRLDTSQHRHAMLMLSDCFPDPNGSRRAARAWRLLCCAATTHEVYLSATEGRPVNLDQWRRVANLAKRVHIESRRPRFFSSDNMHRGAQTWARQHPFDALLVTSPRIWPSTCPIGSGIRVCDFSHAFEQAQPRTPQRLGLLSRLIWPRLRRSQEPLPLAQIITQCDHALVASKVQLADLPTGQNQAVTIADSGALDSWIGLFRQTAPLSSFVTPEVTVMPVQPVPSRKAA